MIRLIPLCFLLAACTPEADVSRAAGAALFAQNCAGCHGDDARGGGSFGQQLFRAPPDLTRLSAQNGGVFPRDRVLSVVDGYRRDQHFSAAMPAFGDQDLGPLVVVGDGAENGTPIPAKLLALAAYLDSIQR